MGSLLISVDTFNHCARYTQPFSLDRSYKTRAAMRAGGVIHISRGTYYYFESLNSYPEYPENH
ncbi:protein of unknown function [Candidatus Methylomirabilis oxygeniifera]|uniref:Uncharacterized protein n=1 Tax=Methylomirabilis oxygeniifera TaxID=671143 RepID=D5MLW4_METO1|nr:protein of unknown function [Candidatus Methylomirabilis oxyfera]